MRDNNLQTADNLETCKKQGSYYTPQVIVRYLVDNALGRYLYGTADRQSDGEPLAEEKRKTAVDIQHLRLILENHLYGVDLDPQAAEIATVNFIMRAMADQGRSQGCPSSLTRTSKSATPSLARGHMIPASSSIWTSCGNCANCGANSCNTATGMATA